jgi:murein DD-endopeptidase MepM/ murein hydrolase activator NlpD
MHPVLHVVMPHNGVDFAAPSGTPIYASAAGVVRSAGDGGPCGNMVQIDHAGGLTSAYCHMSRFAAGLHAGQHVEARQIVGYVGQTGRATGPHLHFAIKRGESYIDPLALKLDGVRVVPIAYREEFTKTRAEMDAALDAILLPPAVATKADGKDDKKTEDTVFDDSPGL